VHVCVGAVHNWHNLEFAFKVYANHSSYMRVAHRSSKDLECISDMFALFGIPANREIRSSSPLNAFSDVARNIRNSNFSYPEPSTADKLDLSSRTFDYWRHCSCRWRLPASHKMQLRNDNPRKTPPGRSPRRASRRIR